MAHARSLILVLGALSIAGCSGVRKTVDGWMADVAPETAAQQGSVYYAASDGLVVHADASGGSAVVGRLPLYEKVVRTDQKNGYAYVTSDGGLAGWVDNAQLIWRLPASAGAPAAPAASTTAAPAAAAAPPAAGDAASAPASGADAASAPASLADDAGAPPPDGVQPAAADPAAAAFPAPTPVPGVQPVSAPQPTAQRGQAMPEMFDPF